MMVGGGGGGCGVDVFVFVVIVLWSEVKTSYRFISFFAHSMLIRCKFFATFW